MIEFLLPTVILTLKAAVFLFGIIIAIAYLTLAERKVLAAAQMRWGANVIGPFGLFQPFADGIKLMHKEVILPDNIDLPVFLLSPLLIFALSLAAWAVMPFGEGLVFADINLGILYVLAIGSMSVLTIVMAGMV
jgi:NADH-quinone oxidoreductase subunit H